MDRREALRWLGGGAAGLVGIGCGAARAAEPRPTGSETSPVEELQTRTIPADGASIPVIGLGTWQTFDVGRNAEERAPLRQVLADFVALGGSLVDSSPMYGRSEEVVGDLAAALALRPKLFVATKVWTSGKQAGIEELERSARRLRADPIDLVQVHNLVDVETHLATLRECKAAGRVRYVGITHYTRTAHAEVGRLLAAEPLDFVQINYSVVEREAEERLLPLARERRVAVIANRPFGGGDALRRLRTRPVPSWAAEIDCTSWAQLLLKFVVSHPALACAIPATSKVEHLRDNMRAGRGRMPDEALRGRIVEAAR